MDIKLGDGEHFIHDIQIGAVYTLFRGDDRKYWRIRTSEGGRELSSGFVYPLNVHMPGTPYYLISDCTHESDNSKNTTSDLAAAIDGGWHNKYQLLLAETTDLRRQLSETRAKLALTTTHRNELRDSVYAAACALGYDRFTAV